MRAIHAWAFGGCDKLDQVVCGPQVKMDRRAFETKELNT